MEATIDKVILKGSANLQRGLEAVGGHLTLTSVHLLFEPHKLNIQRDHEKIILSQIAEVTERWTKFLNFIPIAPNSLLVVSTSGEEYRFVLHNRKAWAAAINEYRGT
jgi:hypothetical protein